MCLSIVLVEPIRRLCAAIAMRHGFEQLWDAFSGLARQDHRSGRAAT